MSQHFVVIRFAFSAQRFPSMEGHLSEQFPAAVPLRLHGASP